MRVILAVSVLATATTGLTACGSSGGPGAAASTPAGTAPAATGEASPGGGAGAGLRARVHADAATMMADIKAAEDRGDVVDGVPVGASSNPYDYVGVSPVFVKIVALGEQALPAIAAEILASKHDGLREYLLAAAGAQISGETAGGTQSWSSGREWAEQYRETQE
jgi:hypothetical protein